MLFLMIFSSGGDFSARPSTSAVHTRQNSLHLVRVITRASDAAQTGAYIAGEIYPQTEHLPTPSTIVISV